MVISTMNRILCRRWLAVYFISLFLFCTLYVHGEESTCKLLSTENCTNVIVTIDENSANNETWFNLYYYPAEKKKLVAVLHYDESYICIPTNDYKCTNINNVTFNINSGCETLQNVVLVGDGQQSVTCLPLENTEPGNSVNHSIQRCACPNESPELSADIRTLDDTGGGRGDLEVSVHIGVIIGTGVGLILLTIVAAVLFSRRKSILLCIRRGYIPKYPHPGNEDP